MTGSTGEQKSKKASEALRMLQIKSLDMTDSQISPQTNNPFSIDPDFWFQSHLFPFYLKKMLIFYVRDEALDSQQLLKPPLVLDMLEVSVIVYFTGNLVANWA